MHGVQSVVQEYAQVQAAPPVKVAIHESQAANTRILKP
jgi:hypothetical protein